MEVGGDTMRYKQWCLKFMISGLIFFSIVFCSTLLLCCYNSMFGLVSHCDFIETTMWSFVKIAVWLNVILSILLSFQNTISNMKCWKHELESVTYFSLNQPISTIIHIVSSQPRKLSLSIFDIPSHEKSYLRYRTA